MLISALKAELGGLQFWKFVLVWFLNTTETMIKGLGKFKGCGCWSTP